MSVIRASTRLLGFTLSTLILYAIYMSGYFVLYPLDNFRVVWRNKMVRFWAKTTAKILGVRLTVNGTPPKAPFFLVCNHLSYVDIIPLFIYMDCVFIAKSEVKSWPLIGRMARSIGVIFVNRELKRDVRRVNRIVASNITDRRGVVLFPEGTSTRGDRVKEFKSSLLRHAARMEFPVSFASITYRTDDPAKPASEWICWWGDMTFLDHFFNMLRLKSFDTIITFGERTVVETDRKKLANRLHQLVERQFIPIETE